MSDEVRALIEEKRAYMEAGDHHGVLGVAPEAGEAEVKRAFLLLVKRLHPDRLARVDLGDTRAVADRVFKAVNDAYAALSDPARRAAAQPKASEPTAASPDVEEMDFDQLFRMPPAALGNKAEAVAAVLDGRGSMLFAKGQIDDAERHLRRAVELSPANPVLQRKLGWFILKNDAVPAEKRVRSARPFLESAVARAPYNADARYAMAQLFRMAGELDLYRRELEAVTRCEGRHRRAEAELTRLKARQEQQKGAKKRGLLDRLLGRG